MPQTSKYHEFLETLLVFRNFLILFAVIAFICAFPIPALVIFIILRFA